MFDLGGSKGHLRACPFLETWRASLCGEVCRSGAVWYPWLECFWGMHDSEHHLPEERTSDPYVFWLIADSSRSQADTWELGE